MLFVFLSRRFFLLYYFCINYNIFLLFINQCSEQTQGLTGPAGRQDISRWLSLIFMSTVWLAIKKLIFLVHIFLACLNKAVYIVNNSFIRYTRVSLLETNSYPLGRKYNTSAKIKYICTHIIHTYVLQAIL